jgi:hypothetical protein
MLRVAQRAFFLISRTVADMFLRRELVFAKRAIRICGDSGAALDH